MVWSSGPDLLTLSSSDFGPNADIRPDGRQARLICAASAIRSGTAYFPVELTEWHSPIAWRWLPNYTPSSMPTHCQDVSRAAIASPPDGSASRPMRQANSPASSCQLCAICGLRQQRLRAGLWFADRHRHADRARLPHRPLICALDRALDVAQPLRMGA
jgi:hypothetical protein